MQRNPYLPLHTNPQPQSFDRRAVLAIDAEREEHSYIRSIVMIGIAVACICGALWIWNAIHTRAGGAMSTLLMITAFIVVIVWSGAIDTSNLFVDDIDPRLTPQVAAEVVETATHP